MSLTEWSSALCEALGIEPDFEIDDILDMARDAAHLVERPAAPLSAFLVGYAAATRGGTAADVSECLDIVTELAEGQED
jgi:hypothetical protein